VTNERDKYPGAFRTGKSFLLSWFLRYLDYRTSLNNKERTGATTTSGTPWYKSFDSLGKDGFSWKGGAERNTTGIWMWSEPFLLRDDLAVLLIDTQGMFDHDTTMELTASIFGLSTLLSSLLIYNVDKQVQEDNLQQLALFSEYARMGVGESAETEAKEKESMVEVNDEGNISVVSDQPKPFQQIEFLVRDWQHFDEVDEDEGNLEKMEGSMKKYIDKVLAARNAKDLQDTREHIVNCFEKITCYGLCHPGTVVTKKSYGGEIGVLDETFLKLLVRYCERVFDPQNLQAKEIHGQVLTAEQLGVFMEAYADMFASGAKFPPAGTMLEATANANNTNATHLGIAKYKQEMDRIAGPACTSYISPEELKVDHAKILQDCLRTFAAKANFGSKKNIAAARKELQQEIESFFTYYESLNESRNPLAGMELYVGRIPYHCFPLT
jgi:atlastin